jgi:hypothetical protein
VVVKVASEMMRTNKRCGWMLWVGMVGTGVVLGGCGYTDLEMAAKQRQIDALVAQVNAMKAGASPACHPTDDRRPARSTSTRALSSR